MRLKCNILTIALFFLIGCMNVSAITLENGDFEDGINNWIVVGSAKSTSNSRTGKGALKLKGAPARVHQWISVEKNTNYILTAYVAGSGKIGVNNGVDVVKKIVFDVSNHWTKQTLLFNSKSKSRIQVYTKYNDVDGKAYFDDISIAKADTDEPVDTTEPAQSLTDRAEVFNIPLSGTAYNGTTTTNSIYPATRPNGGMTLGWNEGDQGHLLRLDADMKPDTTSEGGEWDLDGLLIVSVLGLEDDGVAILASNHTSQLTNFVTVDRHLRLFIYDSKGNKTRETSLVGGNGVELGNQWFYWSTTRSASLVAHGDRFGVFIGISDYRIVSAGVHEGDLYLEIDEDGNIDESKRDDWSTSHSLRQHLIIDENGDNWRLAVGDASPFGILFEVQSQYSVDDTTVWPDEEQQLIGRSLAPSSISAGDLCGFQLRDGRFFATLASGREQPFDPSSDNADVLLLSWPMGVTQGDPINETWLTETSDIPETCPTLTAFGEDNQLMAWGTRNGDTATLALLDAQGNLVNEPIATDLPFHKYSLAIPRADGSVAWAYAENKATSVQIVIVHSD